MKAWHADAVKKMIRSILVILSIAVFLSGCKKTASPSPELTSGIPNSPMKDRTPMGVNPAENPYYPPMDDAPVETIATKVSYPPPVISTSVPETPELIPTPLESPGVLNRKDPSSLIHWLQYGLTNQDISFISPLLADNIWYSLAFSDHPGEILTKKAFLSELERRLSNASSCFSYIFRTGEITTLEIYTEGWAHPWEFDGEEWDYLVLDFSDQWTKEEGLFLFGAYVSRGRGGFSPNEKSCP
jgi:hypothetical protein